MKSPNKNPGFACHVSLNDTDVEYKALGATGSGHITEPTLHTVIRCRFPYAVLPEWLGGSWNRTGWNLELHELDGVLPHPDTTADVPLPTA